jgi:iron-sulfur cluster repair protein YtfE (RIC family)
VSTTTTAVTEPLRAEHRQLAPHLDELRAVAALVGAWSATVDRLNDVVTFMRDHLMSHAHAEEAVLYPAVEKAMGAPGAMDTMIADHRDIARRIDRLVDTAAEIGPGPARAEEVEELKGQLYGLWAILRLHFEKEEQVLLPVLDATLTPAEARRLFEDMSAHVPHHSDEVAT